MSGSIGSSTATRREWWHSAVIYQIYIRSFADGDGDGVGDIAGIRSRVPYLAALGVDAVWINPWYPSPMADAGYDVSDYRSVERQFGTMEEAEQLIGDLHGRGMRVMLDIVPNHTSVQHAWFQAALASGSGAPERDLYVFRPGRGPAGELPPNDWLSVFGGSAWTQVPEPDGSPGEWYLHLFAPEQPDLNWEHPRVRADFEATLRFWFDRGVDGFRIDVAHSLIKEPGLPDLAGREYPPPKVEVHGELVRAPWQAHPHWDRDEVHDIYREWRAIADSYDPPRVFVAEAWVDEPERLTRYVRPDELHTAFNFHYLQCPWVAGDMRKTIDLTLTEHKAIDAPATWVLSNHDVVRHVSRYAREQTGGSTIQLKDLLGRPADWALGTRRARAALLLTLALPGSAYVYQGEELGLPEVEDLPPEALQDPTWTRSGHTDRGRDGCRVPLPWSGDRPPYGFSRGSDTQPWLPQPRDWAPLTVEAQTGDPDSTLCLYRRALHLRRDLPALGEGMLAWRDDLPASVLGFDREPGFTCLVNFGPEPSVLPKDAQVILSSGPRTPDDRLPADTAVWIQR